MKEKKRKRTFVQNLILYNNYFSIINIIGKHSLEIIIYILLLT